MPPRELSPIEFERASEQLRQERESFNQQKKQNNLWFCLRLVMGYSSVVILLIIAGVSAYIIAHSERFDSKIVLSASIGMIGDIVGLMISVWKVVLNPQTFKEISPVTKLK